MNNGPYGPTPGPLAPSQYGEPPQQGFGGPSGGGYRPPADDAMGWAAIACSSLAWVSCCCSPIPFVGFIAFGGGLLLAVAGVICGYMALQKAKQQSTRTDLAMIGLVMGAVRLGLTALVFVGVIAMVVLGVGGVALESLLHPH